MAQQKQKCILVADDEKNTLETLEFILEANNFNVIGVENGQEALLKILAKKETINPVDLLITDVNMPLLTGIDLINFLHQFKIDIPVLIISNYNHSNIKKQIYEVDRVKCLEKPFEGQELLDAVYEIFNNKSVLKKRKV